MTEKYYKVRLARSNELELLNEIEIATASQFKKIGFDFVAEMEPIPLDILKMRHSINHLWVVAKPNSLPVGFASVSIMDGSVYLEEVSVHPNFGRQGLGTLLVESICKWAKENEYQAVTLSTYQDIPWNAPFYTRLGFQVIAEDKLGPGLLTVQAHEKKLGLNKQKRVCMQKNL